MCPFSNFHFLVFKNSIFVDLPCLYRFLLFISCLLIYMLNYLMFLSMVHEYAYFLWIYLETGQLIHRSTTSNRPKPCSSRCSRRSWSTQSNAEDKSKRPSRVTFFVVYLQRSTYQTKRAAKPFRLSWKMQWRITLIGWSCFRASRAVLFD